MLKKIYLIFIFVLLVSLNFTANEELLKADNWEPVNGSVGDLSMISAVITIPGSPDAVLVGYENGAVYKTANAKMDVPVWEVLIPETAIDIHGKHMVTGIAVNPDNVNEIFVSFAGERYGYFLWKTIDGGNNWQPVPSGNSNIWNISINPINTDIMYAVTNGNIIVSEDCGYSWSYDYLENDPLVLQLDIDERVSFVTYDPADENYIYAGTSKGRIFEKNDITDSTAEWICIANGELPNKIITSISAVTFNGVKKISSTLSSRSWSLDRQRDRVWIKNGNNDWENIHNANLTVYEIMNNICFNPYLENVLYTSYYYDGSFRSIDNGIEWVSSSSGSGKNIKILYKNGDFYYDEKITDNHIKPHLNVVNFGNVDVSLDEITIRYWYTIDSSSSQNSWIDYILMGDENITMKFVNLYNPPFSYARKNSDYYLEIGFKNSYILQPGESTGPIELRFNKVDWSNYNESNDHSYMGDIEKYIQNNNITVYKNDKLIWGVEPEFN